MGVLAASADCFSFCVSENTSCLQNIFERKRKNTEGLTVCPQITQPTVQSLERESGFLPFEAFLPAPIFNREGRNGDPRIIITIFSLYHSIQCPFHTDKSINSEINATIHPGPPQRNAGGQVVFPFLLASTLSIGKMTVTEFTTPAESPTRNSLGETDFFVILLTEKLLTLNIRTSHY